MTNQIIKNGSLNFEPYPRNWIISENRKNLLIYYLKKYKMDTLQVIKDKVINQIKGVIKK